MYSTTQARNIAIGGNHVDSVAIFCGQDGSDQLSLLPLFCYHDWRQSQEEEDSGFGLPFSWSVFVLFEAPFAMPCVTHVTDREVLACETVY